MGLWCWGLLICLAYGRIALSPLDNSIVFDAGWRVLSGQQFFVDFTAPNGFVPAGIEAFFFQVFGVNWWAHCLHAAVFNGFFCALSYMFLRGLGGKPWLAGIYAALSGIVFYVPIGTAYPDQTAFFFGFAMLTAMIWSVRAGPRLRRVLWSLLPVLFLLAALSKQIPSVFFLPAYFLLFLHVPRKQWLVMLACLLGGCLVAVALFFLLLPGLSLRDPNDWYFLYELPAQLGAERFAGIDLSVYKWFKTLNLRTLQVLNKANFIHSLGLYLPLFLLPVLLGIQKYKQFSWKLEKALLAPLVWAWLLLWTCSLFVLLTLNQAENGIPFVFICVGVYHSFYDRLLSMLPVFAKRPGAWKRLLVVGVHVLLLGNAIWDAGRFHVQVNATRKVADIELSAQVVPAWPDGFAGLNFLDYQAAYWYGDLDPEVLLEFLQENSGPFYLWGDLSGLYGLRGQASLNPALWYHYGLTMAPPGSPRFADYGEAVRQRCETHGVRWLIFENWDRRTSTNVRFWDFPDLQAWVEARTVRFFEVGGFKVVELTPLPSL